jgi:FkbM family methyltransferase
LIHANALTGWIYSLRKKRIGTQSFLSISIGCNKGTDAIHTARLGLSDLTFDIPVWKETLKDLGVNGGVCGDHEQGIVNHPKRRGEVHCVEPMINNAQLVKNASKLMALDDKEFIVIQAAISSRGGNAKFPVVGAGTENAALDWCGQICNSSIAECCPDVNMYSLDSYVDNFVVSKGPINILLILREVTLMFSLVQVLLSTELTI